MEKITLIKIFRFLTIFLCVPNLLLAIIGGFVEIQLIIVIVQTICFILYFTLVQNTK
jgi:hypothetical protein